MSKISHILLPDPVVVSTGTTLVEAAQRMKKNKVASVLISKNGKLAGIISVEDIMSRVAAEADMNIEVDEVMHSPELTIDSDKWLTDAIAMFERCKASHITVIEHGEKVGVIRAEDILHTYRFNQIMEEEKR
jgi:signal-transduction protein with cAMP-binding, CBS, and nucleotidyltransferase domain